MNGRRMSVVALAAAVCAVLAPVATAQPNPGTKKKEVLDCPAPCNDKCEFEISTEYTYDGAGNLTKVRLGHRRGAKGADCDSDIIPGVSSVSTTVGGVTKGAKYDPNGKNNVAGDRNNLQDFFKDLDAAGWKFVGGDGVNSMEFTAAAIDKLEFSFESILVCICLQRAGDGKRHYTTKTTTMSGKYDSSTDKAKGPKDDYKSTKPVEGTIAQVPSGFGTGTEALVYADEDIAPELRILNGEARKYDLGLGRVDIGEVPMLVLSAWNVRDVTRRSDTRLFLNGLEYVGAFDFHDLDMGPGIGGAQTFLLPITGALRDSMLGGEAVLVIQYNARDDQFIALDTIGLNPGSTLEEGCYADCDGNGRLDIRDFFCFQSRYAEGCR